ncbi:ABC transporter substrate-binding protein [Microbacterium halotolerans]|uniref:ABC transporter substrate-binding protein n=1 Tax=Microbacterium halotolerans TaxID=246613 RepID=UPI0013C35473|nr:ABC transporter substrate-binding protein [Microbacterium halotolerans]
MISARSPKSGRSRLPRATAGTALFAAGALALAGCGGSGPAGGGEGELQEMTAVTFLPMESFTFAPEMYAYAGGYFADHGLDVTLEPVKGTAAAVQAVLGGAADITRVSSIDSMPPLEDGQSIVPIGTMAYKSNLRVVSSEGNPIESPADMADQTMGMGSIGGTSEKMLNLALDAGGVDRDSVTRQAVPVTGATYQLVKQEQLAGYIVSLDTSIQLGLQNPDAVVTDAGLAEAPDIQTWLATQDSLDDEQSSQNITAFLAAIEDAVQDIIDDADNDFENVIATLRDSGDFDFAALDDDDVAAQALDFYVNNTWVDPDGDTPLLAHNSEAWTHAYDTYVEAGLLDGGQDPAAWLDSDHLPAEDAE